MGQFRKVKNLPVRRKLALHTWGRPGDPSIYSTVEVDMTNALPYLESVSEASGVKVTPTHLVAKGVALAMARYPDLNGVIKWGNIYLRDTVDIAFLVALEDGKDLNNITVREADKKDLLAIAQELNEAARAMRKGHDEKVAKQRANLKRVPNFLMGPLMDTLEFLSFEMGLDLKPLGVESDKFGSATITSVGMLGIENAHAPLVPFTRVPLVCLVGEVKDKPVVVDGQVVARPILTLGFTIDHRFVDGVLAAKMLAVCKAYWEDPAAVEAPATAAASVPTAPLNGHLGANGATGHKAEQPA